MKNAKDANKVGRRGKKKGLGTQYVVNHRRLPRRVLLHNSTSELVGKRAVSTVFLQ